MPRVVFLPYYGEKTVLSVNADQVGTVEHDRNGQAGRSLINVYGQFYKIPAPRDEVLRLLDWPIPPDSIEEVKELPPEPPKAGAPEVEPEKTESTEQVDADREAMAAELEQLKKLAAEQEAKLLQVEAESGKPKDGEAVLEPDTKDESKSDDNPLRF